MSVSSKIRPGAPWPWHCRTAVLLSVGEKGRRPSRRPPGPAKKSRVLRCFVLFPFFPIFRVLWFKLGQLGPTWASGWANIGLKMGQHSPKMGQHSPKMGQHSCKMGQHSPKMGQHSPKMGQHSPKMGQHSPKIGRRPSKYPAFYSVFLLFPFFGSFGSTRVNMGQHRPQDRPT